MLNRIKEQFAGVNVEFNEYMVHSHVQPHTKPIKDLETCSNGKETAEYYFSSRYFDLIDDEFAKKMVYELKKLQITDRESSTYGCMCWYREESFVTDTNGAFFVILPIALAYKLCFDRLTDSEINDIEEILNHAGNWFSKETKGRIYYSNKIMSDGAMLALINNITGEYKNECHEFWNRWLKYENDRGWGWGENISDHYSNIMLTALNVAVISIKDEGIREQIIKKREKLLEYIMFHEGKEFVPSIRTYNFSGDKNYGGYVYKCLNEPDNIENIEPMRYIIMLESGMKFESENALQRVRKERIFDDSYAYTWKGNNIRMGTVSKFPAMQNSYQHEGHGLGWQSMPVSVLIEDVHVSFLRMRAVVDGEEYCHPATDKRKGRFHSRLFEDGNLETIHTQSSQNQNVAVVIRGLNRVDNTTEGIYDEWCVPKGSKAINECVINKRKWFIVTYEKNAVAVTNIGGFAHEYKVRKELECSIKNNSDFDLISATLYSGENRLLFSERLESAWVIIVFEDTECIEQELKNVKIKDETLINYYEAERAKKQVRRIVCSYNECDTILVADPNKE